MASRFMDSLQVWFARHPRQHAMYQLLVVPVEYAAGAVLGVMDAHEEVRKALRGWPKGAYVMSKQWREELDL